VTFTKLLRSDNEKEATTASKSYEIKWWETLLLTLSGLIVLIFIRSLIKKVFEIK